MQKIILAGAVVSVALLSGCMSNQEKMDLETRISALEAKSNDAMRAANAAKIDASTALYIAEENQKKLK